MMINESTTLLSAKLHVFGYLVFFASTSCSFFKIENRTTTLGINMHTSVVRALKIMAIIRDVAWKVEPNRMVAK